MSPFLLGIATVNEHTIHPMVFVPLLALLSQTATRPTTLEARLRHAIASSGAEVAVAYRTVDGAEELLIDADSTFHAASTMKVAVMIELFAQATSGRLALSDSVLVKNEFRSIVDGSTYTLQAGDDSDRDVYTALGKTMTLAQLCEAMITVSSNFATNVLIEKLGVENIRNTVTRLGAGGMQVLRGVEDGKAFAKGLNNTTTARGLLTLFEKLARGVAVDPSSDAAMVEVLKRQKFNDAIPAGVPAGTPVAHKTGAITRIHHDAGIIFGPRPYVLVLLVRGIEDKKQSAALMTRLSRIVYDHASAPTP
jgi:beta-lactamase class A